MAQSGADKWLRAWGQMGVASGEGWDASIKNVDTLASPGPKAFLYLFDLPTRWTWMCSAKLGDFHEISTEGRKARATDIGGVRDDLAALIVGAAEGGCALSPEKENALGVFASMYAGTTKAYAHANGFPERCHFVVAVYRKPGSMDMRLRPFAMESAPDKPVEAGVVRAMIEQVVAMDRMRHPEWF